jgi:tetratricopeptide (TPR) repeat protein/predicted Ser/Thr protein kinase
MSAHQKQSPDGGDSKTLDGGDARTLNDRPVRKPTSQEPPKSPSLPVPGQRLVNRYAVLKTLGEGGMGVVLAAYDEQLDRRVALKLLRQVYAENSTLEARLVREAQAMARLNHPHVVAVYDSGRLEDGTFFIAMEYVAGVTLQAWCQQTQRSWREVLGAYLDAGRGLAAAHSAGLIHRDFKPANVLVGRDGRVRVTDFGVARLDSSFKGDSVVRVLGAWKTPLTLPGHVVGTPYYLAPELFNSQPAGERSDLFSFCVALYEALYGQPPFAGATANERMRARQEGHLTPPPEKTQVPVWVGRAVMQGLSADPEKRPPSMQALIATLQNDPEVGRREWPRVGIGVFGIVALVGLAAWGGWRWHGSGCSTMERRLVGVWDAPIKAQMREMLTGTGLPYAADTAQQVESTLDRYAGAWMEMSQEVCEAANTRLEQARGLMVLREACLERRRSQLRALTELFTGRRDPELVPKALQAAQALSPLEYCADEKALLATVPPPEESALRERMEKLQQQVDQLEVLLQVGEYAEGLRLANKVLLEVQGVDSVLLELVSVGHLAKYSPAEQPAKNNAYRNGFLGFAPLKARALLYVAEVQLATGDYQSAETQVRKAIPLAARGGDTVLLARAWNLLAFVMGYRQIEPQEALVLQLALDTVVELPRDDLVRANILNNQGVALRTMGRYEEALKRHGRALSFQMKVLGSGHPETSTSIIGQGNVLDEMGKYGEALMNLEFALELKEEALGPDHPDLAVLLDNLGIVLEHLGRYEDALAQHGRSRTLREKAWGPEHSLVALSLTHQGNVLRDMGRYSEALALYERSLALREKALGPEHPDVASSLTNLGNVLLKMGRYQNALPYLERALAVEEKALGPAHPDMAETLLRLGELHLAQHRSAPQAVTLLERALALSRANDKAEVQFVLARALWESGGDKQRAVNLATQAHDKRQVPRNSQQAEVAQWLATHTLP